MPLYSPDFVSIDGYPEIEPSLKLDFANARALDPRITFTRASVATYVGKDGLIKTAGVNEPRFDHDPATGESLGLLVEEETTNLFQNNNDPASGASGTATKSTVQIVLPSGETGPALETDADAFAENYRNLTATANTNPGYLTFYAKKKSAGSTGTLTITMEGGGTARSFNSASINSDTWTKISTTHDWSSSNSTLRRYDIYLQGANTSDSDTSFYVAFQQFEEGTFPTSYIPTSGATATREPEYVYVDGVSVNTYNPEEGTHLIEFKGGRQYPDGDEDATVLSYKSSGFHRVLIASGTTNGVSLFPSATTISYAVDSEISGSNHITSFKTAAFAYSGTTSSLSSDGNVVNGTWDRPQFNNTDSGTVYIGHFNFPHIALNGHIKKYHYYPKRVSDTQLQTLTQ